MKILVACEESQEVCKAFRARGHEAYSCDIQECSGGHPEWHIQGDVLPILNGSCTFKTADSHTHTSGKVGFDNRSPAVHGPGGKRRPILCAEAEGRKAAEIHRVLHADGAGTLRPGCCRESNLHHVERMEETGPDHSALDVRASRKQKDLPVASRATAP